MDVRKRGGIVVVIAHRPAILGAVDHLLVLNEGRMQAFGKSEALLAAGTSAQPQRGRSRRRLDAAE
jgi:ABC-type protease/lipase transport system fused ATPase/permease subunit